MCFSVSHGWRSVTTYKSFRVKSDDISETSINTDHFLLNESDIFVFSLGMTSATVFNIFIGILNVDRPIHFPFSRLTERV